MSWAETRCCAQTKSAVLLCIDGRWESVGASTFVVKDDSANPEQLKRGTKVTLHLKKDQTEYLEEKRLRDLVKRHSEFVGHPVLGRARTHSGSRSLLRVL